MIDLTPLIQAVIMLLATAVTAFVIPYVRSKTTTEQQAQMRSWVQVGVSAAEQIYQGVGQGELKKQYVLGFLNDKGYSLDMSTLSTLIESEVKHLWTPVEYIEAISIDPDSIQTPAVEGVVSNESDY